MLTRAATGWAPGRAGDTFGGLATAPASAQVGGLEPAPAGTQGSSQGRQPLGNGRCSTTSPNGATGTVPVDLPSAVLSPFQGSEGIHASVPRGWRPWLLTAARSGLSSARSGLKPPKRSPALTAGGRHDTFWAVWRGAGVGPLSPPPVSASYTRGTLGQSV